MSGVARYPWHQAQWQQISAARAAGRLPHAILLTGPPGLGKAEFARRLSDALVCTVPDGAGDACGQCAACRQSRAGSHPDQHLLAPEAPGKMIRIDAVRELSARSVLAAQDGGYRVFRIEPADAMNRAAANALLKTLEEPVSRSVLVLTSSHPHRLPATIRSRCQSIRFGVPAVDEVKTWLAGQVNDTDVDALLAISGGAPLRALQAMEQGWIDDSHRLADDLEALKGRRVNPLQVVEKWEARPLSLLLDALKRVLNDLVRLGNGLEERRLYHPALGARLQSLGQGIDLRQLYGLADELFELDREISRNLNPQMLLENLANRWLQITRPGGH